MKKVLFALITLSALGASAKLESFYGRVKTKGFKHTCTYHNSTGHTLDFKYVVVTFAHRSGDSHDYDVQERIDRVVRAGDSISSSVSETYGMPQHCRFLARK